MPDVSEEAVEVTQADRDAAARAYDQHGLFLESERATKGLLDDGYYCQAFAHHRRAASRRSITDDEVERLWSALTEQHGSYDNTWLQIGRSAFEKIASAALTCLPAPHTDAVEKAVLAEREECARLAEASQSGRHGEEPADSRSRVVAAAILSRPCEHGHGDPMSLCNQCEAREIDGSASAPAEQEGAGPLVEFFRDEGFMRFGRVGDYEGWSTEQTAVHFLREHLKCGKAPAEQDRIGVLLDSLQQAEAEYRLMHDRHGDGSQAAGRAWDLMRRAGNKARAALNKGQSDVSEGGR